MAYSDYGGYAYRNGEHILTRSDCAICSEGMMSSPGIWPGFAMMMEASEKGGNLEEARQKALNCNIMHVLLGDGPITVGLYKQSSISLWKGMDPLPLAPFVDEQYISDWKEGNFFSVWDWDEEQGSSYNNPPEIQIEGNRLSIICEESDNHYSYVQWVQPDGVIWHGFSGYGVGAGFEDAEYGYSTEEQEDRLFELFRRPQRKNPQTA